MQSCTWTHVAHIPTLHALFTSSSCCRVHKGKQNRTKPWVVVEEGQAATSAGWLPACEASMLRRERALHVLRQKAQWRSRQQ